MADDVPHYVEGAKFLRHKEEPLEWLYPRDPSEYSPTDKCIDRFQQLKGTIDGDHIADAIMYGELYPAARSCAAFVTDLRGVAFYVVVTADFKGTEDLPDKSDRDEWASALQRYDGIDQEDFRHKTITLWPYVYDRDTAWHEGGWSSQQLDLIKSLEPDLDY